MNTAEKWNETRSQKNYERIRSLVIQMANLKHPGLINSLRQNLPYCLMRVNKDNIEDGFFILNIYGCRLGENENRKVDSSDITHWHDLNLSGLSADTDGNYYLWQEDNAISEPWASYKKMESYRQQLITVFYIDNGTAMKGREIPYHAVL